MFSQVKHKRTENCFSRCYCWDSSVLSCFWGKKLHRWFLFCFLSIRNTSISMSIFTCFGVQVSFIIFMASICLQMAVHSECGYSVLGKMGRRARLILCLSVCLALALSVSLALFLSPSFTHPPPPHTLIYFLSKPHSDFSTTCLWGKSSRLGNISTQVVPNDLEIDLESKTSWFWLYNLVALGWVEGARSPWLNLPF